MDKKHDIQHIDFEFGVVVLALSGWGESERDRTDLHRFEIRGGYGSMCPWGKKGRLQAYKLMRGWLDKTIEEMER